MAESYKKEFGFTHHRVTKPLNDKYRACRKDIENTFGKENEFTDTMCVINARKLAILPIADKLNVMNENGELHVPLDSLLTSLIHITMNRWFRAQNRLYEMVIYEFLSRYYASEMARDKYNPKKINA